MYGWMALSVLVSAIVAYYAGKVLYFQITGGFSWVLLIAWFILPFILGRTAMRNAVVGFVELMVYAGLTGLMFSNIFMVYTGTTITSAFVSSASVFVAMSAVGLFTKKSLAKLGTQLFGAMIGLIVAMIVNIFLKSSMIALFLSFAAVVIFSLLTMFDAHQMKAMYNNFHDQISINGLAINGALALYLDFINIFISLLEIFGGFGNNNN
ncbi:MAG: Bax inhibitor-1/YccA family protein [Acetilactobacillus jinshanensis]